MRHFGWNRLGRHVETPQLCLDLSALDANVSRMARILDHHKVQWRPHTKCHKSPEIARRQIAAGAIGVTCAKVSEAECFAAAGMADILLAHPPAGAVRLARISELCRTADLIVTCDHYAQAAPLSEACRQRGVTCRILIDIDVGMHRTGIAPGRDALELAQAITQLPGLKLVGVMGYEGHAMTIADAETRTRLIRESLGVLNECRIQFLNAGLCCDIVSAGGTGSLTTAVDCPGITELQAGGGIFGDPYYTSMPDSLDYEPALTVLTTVVSRPTLDRAILDCGRKGLTGERHSPLVKHFPDARITMHHAEHIALELGPESRNLRIGDLVELIVGYADFTTQLHDEYFCFRGDELVEIWPVARRGTLH